MKNNNEAFPALRVQLLGPFRVWRGGILIDFQEWKTHKHQSLFKILVSQRGRFFSAEELVEWLWPAAPPEQALAAARKRVSELRKTLQPRLAKGSDSLFLLTRLNGYCFNPDADCLVDLEEFDLHDRQGRACEQQESYPEAIRAYEAAARWYQGEYLVEDHYEEWASLQRERSKGAHLKLLLRLAECYARTGQYQRAIARCTRAIEIYCDAEDGYLKLMRYHALAGQWEEAQGAYERCRKALHRQLGLELSPAVQELHDQILQHRIPPMPSSSWRSNEPWLHDRERVPFIGREAELGRLQRHLQAVGRGGGRLVLISGEAGIGKTRLAFELVRSARRAGSCVLHGHCSPGLADPYHPLIAGLSQLAPQLTPGDVQGVERIWLATAAQLAPALRACIPPCDQRPPPLPAKQGQARQREALVQLLLALARSPNFTPPLVLFIDDLHHAAPSLLDWLAYLSQRMTRSHLLVIIACRSEGLVAADPLVEWRQALVQRRARVFRELHAEPLSWATAEQLATQLTPDLSLRQRQRVARRSGGNPLFLLTLLQQETKEKSSGVTLSPRLVSTDLASLILHLLKNLTSEEQRLLSVAAVIGTRFERKLLRQVWNRDVAHLEEVLNTLTQRGLLLIQQDGLYAFSHEQVRNAVYDALGPERTILHRRVADALEKVYAHGLDRLLGAIASHRVEAGQWPKALDYAQRALERAMMAYENREGLQWVALGLHAAQRLFAAEGKRALYRAQFLLLSRRVELCRRLGNRQQQLQDLRRLTKLSQGLGDARRRLETLRLKINCELGLGAYRRAVKGARQALEACKRLKDRRAEAAVQQALGRAHWSLADFDAAVDCYRRSQAIFQALDDQQGKAQVLHHLGALYAHQGNFLKALSHYEAAHQIRLALDDLGGRCASWNNIGNAHRALGNYGTALECYAQCEELCYLVGDQAALAQVLNNLGDLCWLTGMYPKALEHLDKARQLRVQLGDQRGIGNSYFELGAAYWHQGAHDKARQHLQRAAEVLSQVGDRRGQGFALAFLAAVRLDQGDPAKALLLCQEAHALNRQFKAKDLQLHAWMIESLALLSLGQAAQALKRSGRMIQALEQAPCHFYPQVCYFAHFQALQACGRAEAKRYLQRAHREVLRRAKSLPDPDLRAAFLNRVPVNREIIRCYEAKTKSSRS